MASSSATEYSAAVGGPPLLVDLPCGAGDTPLLGLLLLLRHCAVECPSRPQLVQCSFALHSLTM